MPVKKDKKIKALILTANMFEDMELFFPWFRLLEEGIEVEIEEGEAKNKLATVKNLLSMNEFSIDKISQITGFTVDQINQIKKTN